MRSLFSLLVLIGLLFILFHISPHTALRTHLLFNGHPNEALTAEITVDAQLNELEKARFELTGESAYTLDKPPVDRNTGQTVSQFTVSRKGFIYLAKPYAPQ
ncbi:hypothetical protein [Indiicoccus explosivorum]|uniref:hypothetical protein n=1 Tax=Indiicoccus explosivorum TaxID=1917864 RepID=UPI000B44CE51|nr:hypothetical protein [Indiicoccus explosivorum]